MFRFGKIADPNLRIYMPNVVRDAKSCFWKFGNPYKQLRKSYEIPFLVPAENRAPIISARYDSGGSYTGKSDSISYIETIFLVPAENMAPIISARYDSWIVIPGRQIASHALKYFHEMAYALFSGPKVLNHIFRPKGPNP